MQNSDELFEHARSRFDHESARRLLREKYQAKMFFAHAGGMWQAGPELLTLLSAVAPTESVVLEDLYQNPVLVNTAELTALARERWQEQMNAWHLEFESIRLTR